ncbi:MAG: TIGR03560 family F420-dependent LLM class oxidoreductase [Actinobacteria bacterium]|nr:TIGR03560 family F420-dependent LLM class oxidoreductase [Actinomycetota bacterium]
MRFSVWPSSGWTWDDIVGLARHAEATGWDGVWVADHFMPNTGTSERADGPMLECWSVLAGLAAAVPRVRLGSLVTSVTYRHPAVLAKIAATVDNVSGGRLVLGVGSGWQTNEHEAYGLTLGSVKERLDRLEEACEILVGLLREPRTSHTGSFFTVADAPADPKPVQSPLPLLVGGRGEKRTMRVAARLADEWNAWTDPEGFAHKVAVLDRHCEDLGRDPAAIRRSTQALVDITDTPVTIDGGDRMPALRGTPAQLVEALHTYAAAGLDEFILPCWGDPGPTRELVDRFAAEVRPELGP